MDQDLDGQITIADFEKGIAKLGGLASCSKEDVRNVFNKMTTVGGVTATYRSLLKLYENRRSNPDTTNSGDFQVCNM